MGAATVREVTTGPAAPWASGSTLGRKWLESAENDPARIRMLLGWRLTRELDERSRRPRPSCGRGWNT